MTLPKDPGKYGRPALFTAQDLVDLDPRNREERLPDGFVLCYQSPLFDYAVRKYRGKATRSPFGQARVLQPKGGRPVGIIGNFGIGAPIAVFVMEWLAARGVQRFLSVGAAGGLLGSQQPGDLVVCDRALRDEGTSYHYLPPADFSRPDSGLTAALGTALRISGYAHTVGGTWTTDAPLRETLPEVEQHRAAGILTVEMEAAALFAAAETLGVACAAAFTISDSPKDGRWQVRFDREARDHGLQALAEMAVGVLSTPG